MWCKSCRVTGYTHCAHPDECGNMVTLTAAADSWKSWLDDAPLPETFNSATGGLQDFITALSRALLTARAELAATQTQVGDWIVRADEANVKVEKLEAELARVRADAQAAVALMVAQAAKIATRHWEGEPEDTLAMEAEIRTLAPADGLAAVEALRVEARENAMQALASMGQAQEAYEAQLEAEAELAAAQQREAVAYRDGWRFAYQQCLATGSVPDPDYKGGATLTPTDPGDGWTWNERLGWIGPDGKPADPRRRG